MKFKIILIAIIVVLIVLLGFNIYNKNKNDDPVSDIIGEQSLVLQPVSLKVGQEITYGEIISTTVASNYVVVPGGSINLYNTETKEPYEQDDLYDTSKISDQLLGIAVTSGELTADGDEEIVDQDTIEIKVE